MTLRPVCDLCMDSMLFTILASDENLALNRPTWQSSNYSNQQGLSKKAVDGNRNTDFFSHSCTQTHKEWGAWWMVELDREYIVTEVLITNRGDCCGEKNFTFDSPPPRRTKGFSQNLCESRPIMKTESLFRNIQISDIFYHLSTFSGETKKLHSGHWEPKEGLCFLPKETRLGGDQLSRMRKHI